MKQEKRNAKKKDSIISKLGIFDRYNFSFILTSIIPLGIMAYLILKYVAPALLRAGESSTLVWLDVLLFFIVFLAILGFFVSRSATRETVRELQQYNNRLNHLFEISQSLSRQTHKDVLLENIVKSAIEMTEASGGIVLLQRPGESRLRFEVSIGTGAIAVRDIGLGEGIAGWVAEHGELLMVNDLKSDRRYVERMNILPNFNTSAILAVPLQTGNKILGVLELLHRKEDGLKFNSGDAGILKSLAGQASIFIANAAYHDDQQNYFIHISELLLSALDGTRQFWKGHLKNTARYSNLLGRVLELSEDEMRALYYAALLHDIGFIKLNLAERPTRKVIELHPELGFEMIYPITLLKEASPLIRYHHERYDGTGYPHKLRGDSIPLGSRILAVAEVFDVLTNPNSYRRKTLTAREAVKELQAYSGTQFDPDVVAALVKITEEQDVI